MHARRLLVVRGSAPETREKAIAAIAALAPDEVVWAGSDAPAGVRAVAPRGLDALLGASADAAVLDLHAGLDADAIARAEGLVRRGGELVLRMSERPVARADLAVSGRALEEVGTRALARFERTLAAATSTAPLAPVAPSTPVASTEEQSALVLRLVPSLLDPTPRLVTLVADRGRGKSAALGRALRAAIDAAPDTKCVVSAPSEDALGEVHRFARPTSLRFVTAAGLSRGADHDADVIVIDEAAQLSVPRLRRIVLAHPRARIVLATTCHGYEGTGRGFALRFVRWARTRGLAVEEHTLTAPIRWDAGDPLERWAYEALVLDAVPATLGAPAVPRHEQLGRDRLTEDERTLRALFGLLLSAHYRTSPDDLVRLLDAPNLDVHALFEGEDVVAACLVAHEGGLDEAAIAALASGRTRLSRHALADTLASHSATPEAARLTMVRSVRIAVHEERRGRGLARRLVEAVHASYAPDLFGTMFGATADLVKMRRALGYALVRVGVSRGARSGEPAAVMIRPVSTRARALVERLRVDLARELPAQLALLEADDGGPLEPALRSALIAELPALPDESDEALTARITRYVEGSQPIDALAASARRFVLAHPDALARLSGRERELLVARLVDRAAWAEVARRAGLEVPAAMRAMRAAMAALLREARAAR